MNNLPIKICCAMLFLFLAFVECTKPEQTIILDGKRISIVEEGNINYAGRHQTIYTSTADGQSKRSVGTFGHLINIYEESLNISKIYEGPVVVGYSISIFEFNSFKGTITVKLLTHNPDPNLQLVMKEVKIVSSNTRVGGLRNSYMLFLDKDIGNAQR